MLRRQHRQDSASILVAGIGGGGCQIVDRLIECGIQGAEFVAVDTDSAPLREAKASKRLHILAPGTANCDIATGTEIICAAADDCAPAIDATLRGTDLLFIVAGLGGRSASAITPLVAREAKRQGALVIAMVTSPFSFEDQDRIQAARLSIERLKPFADTLVVVPNDRLMESARGAIGFHETFRLAHDFWFQSIHGISDLVNHAGLINVDFADLRAILQAGGGAVFAGGRGHGPDRARIAAERATRSDLLNITIDGAQGVLFNIVGGPDMGLLEIEEAAHVITSRVSREANVIFGAAINEALVDEIYITLIATGFRLEAIETSSRHPAQVQPDRFQQRSDSESTGPALHAQSQHLLPLPIEQIF